MLPITTPLMSFADLAGDPLQGGYIYIGQANQNPITTPITIYWDLEGTQPAAQPLRTANGYIVRNGQPAQIFVGVEYSIIVKDSHQQLITYGASSYHFDANAVLLHLLSGPNGAAQVGFQNTQFTGSIQGTLADRIYEWNAVADCDADPTGVVDSTAALDKFAIGAKNKSTIILPPGTYLYNPVIGGGTGVCFLNFLNLSNITLIAYGAIIKNEFTVTTAPNNADHNYGINFQECDDCQIIGLTFNGNRDSTYGTNGDGNEFYSAFTLRGCNRVGLIDCSGINCQGDGYTIGRTAAGVLGSGNYVVRGYWSRNRRNNGSMDANPGGRVIHGRYVDAGYGHGTNPQAHIDIEWEHATVGPAGNDARILIDGPDFSGVGSTGLYIPNTSGVTARDITSSMSSGGAAVQVDSTNVNYATINVQILGLKARQTTGINIVTSGGLGVSGILSANCELYCSYPVTVNTSNGTPGNGFPVSIMNNDFIGESVWSIKVLAGRTKYHGNKAINSSSGAGNYLALFRPLCDIQGNQWERNNDQTAPTYGVIICTDGTIFEDNHINGVAITHPVVYGENSVAAYPAARTNYRNGALLPDLKTTFMFMSPSIDTSSATPVAIYIPNNGLNKILDAQIIVGKSGANVVPTTTLSLGIVGATTKYLNALALPSSQIGSIDDIQSSLASATMDSQVPVFAQIATGNTAPFINIGLTMGYDTASLYTATVLFT